eukprot:105899-Pyramimonas_sp.AAC.1
MKQQPTSSAPLPSGGRQLSVTGRSSSSRRRRCHGRPLPPAYFPGGWGPLSAARRPLPLRRPPSGAEVNQPAKASRGAQ